ncbi:hypothetical protein MA5S0708_4322 [Mycobacteroides abscessus 5S-0708]|nr:hypothetical protein [Mycobacteroides abscessus]EIU22541.1 hypothetical protein MA5S0708_4322 [Mycobacteroides abscessus 5S-0708]EIU24868.1 hypothetical protein MA5S0817_3944 [Mycobacteroides abscessus 5S-0817]
MVRKQSPIRDTQWKVPVHWNKQTQALEQDSAAGGERARRVVHDSEGALGRVVLQARNLRLYAELRWQVNKKQRSKYLCGVAADTRAANLAVGWQRAYDLGLTTTSSAERGKTTSPE